MHALDRHHRRCRRALELLVAQTCRKIEGGEARHVSDDGVRFAVHPRASRAEQRPEREAFSGEACHPLGALVRVASALSAEVEARIEIRVAATAARHRRQRRAVHDAQCVHHRGRQR